MFKIRIEYDGEHHPGAPKYCFSNIVPRVGEAFDINPNHFNRQGISDWHFYKVIKVSHAVEYDKDNVPHLTYVEVFVQQEN